MSSYQGCKSVHGPLLGECVVGVVRAIQRTEVQLSVNVRDYRDVNLYMDPYWGVCGGGS